MKLLVKALAAALVCSVALPGWSVAQELKAGILLPLSGPIAGSGNEVRQGVELAIEHLNAKGGLLGKMVKPIIADDQSTPAVGVSRANEMITNQVDVLFGGWNSAVFLAYQPLLVRAKIFNMVMIAKVDSILENDPHVVKLSPAGAADGEMVGRVVVKAVGAKKVVFVTQNDAYGSGTQAAIEAGIKKYKPDIQILGNLKFQFVQTDFRNILENIRQLKPDAIVIVNSSQASGMAAFLQQHEELGIKIPVVPMMSGITDVTMKVAGKAANGSYCVDIYSSNLPPYDKFASNQKFVAAYKAKYGTVPDMMAASGYLAVEVWSRGVTAAGTTEKAAVSKAIRGAAFKDTVFGDISIEKNGQISGNYVAYKIEQGNRVPMTFTQ